MIRTSAIIILVIGIAVAPLFAGEGTVALAELDLVMPVDQDLDLQLLRFREHIGTKDFSKAFLIMDRLLNADPYQLAPLTKRHYAPLHEVARVMISNLPKDGRDAYAFHCAARWRKAAVSTRLLQQEPDSLFFEPWTKTGYAAGMAWANSLLEQHRFREAEDRLEELLRHPLADAETVVPRLYLVAVALGDDSRAAAAQKSWEALTPSDQAKELWQSVQTWAAKQRPLTVKRRSVPTQLLTPVWRQVIPHRLPRINQLDKSATAFRRDATPDGLGRLWLKHRLPADMPVATDSHLVVSSYPGLFCLDLKTGVQVWSHEPKEGDDEDTLYVDPEVSSAVSPAERWYFRDRLGAMPVVHGDVVCRVESTLPTRQVNAKRGGGLTVAATGPWQTNSLVAYSLADGKQCWTIDLPMERFISVPVVAREHLFVVVESQRRLRLLRIAPVTGAVLGDTVLAKQHNPPVHRDLPIPLTVNGDVVHLQPEAGVVFSLYTNGRWRWASRLPAGAAIKSAKASWQASQMVVCRNQIITGFSGIAAWSVLDQRTGIVLSSWPRALDDAIVGQTATGLLIAGMKQVRLVSPRTGETKWETGVPLITGHGTLAGDALLVPTVEGLAHLDLQAGTLLRMVRVHRAGGQTLPFIGNVLLTDHGLLNAGAGRIERLGPATALRTQLDAEIREKRNLAAHVLRAQLFLQQKQLDRARLDLDRVIAQFDGTDASSLFDDYLRKLTRRKRAEMRPESASAVDLGLKGQGYLYRNELLLLRLQTEEK